MTDTHDAPEHPLVRWFESRRASERFALKLAVGLILGGLLSWAAALVAHGEYQAEAVAGWLMQLGWATLQLGVAIIFVQVILDRAADEELEPAIEDAFHHISQIVNPMHFGFHLSIAIKRYRSGRAESDTPFTKLSSEAVSASKEFEAAVSTYQNLRVRSQELATFIQETRQLLIYQKTLPLLFTSHATTPPEEQIVAQGFAESWIALYKKHVGHPRTRFVRNPHSDPTVETIETFFKAFDQPETNVDD